MWSVIGRGHEVDRPAPSILGSCFFQMLYGCSDVISGVGSSQGIQPGQVVFAILMGTVLTYIQSRVGPVTGEEVFTLDHLQAGRKRKSDNKLLEPLGVGLTWKTPLGHCDDIVRDLLRQGVDDGLRMSRHE
jgi:hypothetical protein